MKRIWLWIIGLALTVVPVAPLASQTTDGSGWGAVGGAVLGTASGSTLGFFGLAIPCSQTHAGPACIRVVSAGSGLIGMASGIAIGSGDIDRLGRTARDAAIGTGFGMALGLALTQFTRRVDWRDVATTGLLGAAIGSQPRGAAIGLGAGAVLGGTLLVSVPGITLPDAVSVVTGGLAVGVLAAWVADAVASQRKSADAHRIIIPVQIRF